VGKLSNDAGGRLLEQSVGSRLGGVRGYSIYRCEHKKERKKTDPPRSKADVTQARGTAEALKSVTQTRLPEDCANMNNTRNTQRSRNKPTSD